MPLITFNTVEGALNEELKQELSAALTETVGDVLGKNIKKNTWIVINEAPEGNFYISNHKLTANDVQKAMK